MGYDVYLLISPRRGNGPAKAMQSIGRRYVRYVNDRHDRTGTLWEARYRAALIEPAPYLLACYRYVELNPVRAAMVDSPADYPWSSYRCHALGEPDHVVTDHPLYLALGRTSAERQAAYRDLFRQAIDPAHLAEIRETVQRSGVLGTERFKDELEAALSRPVRPGKPGRPRKRPEVETPV
jgi:putative transposase